IPHCTTYITHADSFIANHRSLHDALPISLATGIVPKTVAIVPWTTPPILSGYLVTGGSWRGIALQVVNLTVATLMYIPFIKAGRSEEHTSELQSRFDLVCRLLLGKKKNKK